MCCGTEAGSYLRLTDSCVTQLKAQGPSRTCNESHLQASDPPRRSAPPPGSEPGRKASPGAAPQSRAAATTTAFTAPRPPIAPAAILNPLHPRAPGLAGVEVWTLANQVEAMHRNSGARAAEGDAAPRGRQTRRDDDATLESEPVMRLLGDPKIFLGWGSRPYAGHLWY